MGDNKNTWTLLKKPDLMRLVAHETEIKQEEVMKVICGYEKVVKEALMQGYAVNISGVGQLRHAFCKERPEHEWRNGFTQEKIIIPYTPCYNRPSFKPSIALVREMRKATSGDPFRG